MRLVARATLMALAMLVSLDSASRSAPPLGPELEAEVRRALGAELAPDEVARLLARSEVADALAELFSGWDGEGDRFEVGRLGPRLSLKVVIGERRCQVVLETGPEADSPTPRCDDIARPDGARGLDLDPRLWAKPARKPQKEKGPSAASGDAWGEAPVAPPTVLRALTHARSPFGSELVTDARVDHERLREKMGRPGYHDRLLPRTGEAPAVVAGEALAPLLMEEDVPLPASTANLMDPFGAGRMRTDLPVPGPHFGGGGPPPLVPRLTEECEVSWRLRERHETPPALDCYRAYAWHKRLDDNALFSTLEKLTMFLDIPLAHTVMGIIAEDVKTTRAHEVVWAMVWLEWVGRAPEDDVRIGRALSALTVEERRYLRRHLAALWGRLDGAKLTADLGPAPAGGAAPEVYAANLVTRLFERHLLALYPEAKDLDGLPRRAFVSDTWLWANNWLAILDGRAETAITQAYHRLDKAERRVIDAFLDEPYFARRFARAHEVLARR